MFFRCRGLAQARALDLVDLKWEKRSRRVRGVALALLDNSVHVGLFDALGLNERVEDASLQTRALTVPTGASLLGSVISPLGDPHPLSPIKTLSDTCPSSIASFAPAGVRFPNNGLSLRPVHTGNKAIDFLWPVPAGGTTLLMGDRGAPVRDIALGAIASQRAARAFVDAATFTRKPAMLAASKVTACVYAAIGEAASPERLSKTLDYLQTSGTLESTVVVAASSSDAPALRWLTPHTAVTIAANLRAQGHHCVVVYENLTEHAVAHQQCWKGVRPNMNGSSLEDAMAGALSDHARFLSLTGAGLGNRAVQPTSFGILTSIALMEGSRFSGVGDGSTLGLAERLIGVLSPAQIEAYGAKPADWPIVFRNNLPRGSFATCDPILRVYSKQIRIGMAVYSELVTHCKRSATEQGAHPPPPPPPPSSAPWPTLQPPAEPDVVVPSRDGVDAHYTAAAAQGRRMERVLLHQERGTVVNLAQLLALNCGLVQGDDAEGALAHYPASAATPWEKQFLADWNSASATGEAEPAQQATLWQRVTDAVSPRNKLLREQREAARAARRVAETMVTMERPRHHDNRHLEDSLRAAVGRHIVAFMAAEGHQATRAKQKKAK